MEEEAPNSRLNALRDWLATNHGKPQFGEILFSILRHTAQSVLLPVASEWADDRKALEILAELGSAWPGASASALARSALEDTGALEKRQDEVLEFCRQRDSLQKAVAELLTAGWHPAGMEAHTTSRQRDLRGVECPINTAKARMELFRMSPGDTLQLILDPGSPIENVPRAMLEDGHRIVERRRLDDASWLLVVQKR